jgi:excinuclease ABC subunit B
MTRAALSPEELGTRIATMKKAMLEAAKALDFERAAELRDEVKSLEALLLGTGAQA